MAEADRKSWPIVKPYYDAMENKNQWCIAAVPGAAWAKQLFPEAKDADIRKVMGIRR